MCCSDPGNLLKTMFALHERGAVGPVHGGVHSSVSMFVFILQIIAHNSNMHWSDGRRFLNARVRTIANHHYSRWIVIGIHHLWRLTTTYSNILKATSRRTTPALTIILFFLRFSGTDVQDDVHVVCWCRRSFACCSCALFNADFVTYFHFAKIVCFCTFLFFANRFSKFAFVTSPHALSPAIVTRKRRDHHLYLIVVDLGTCCGIRST